jgi:outer membrane protein OmpA-like peptidoglycan-associated protein
MRTLVIVSSVLLLSACSSAPKPPTVDGSNREGINSASTEAVLSLKADLAQTKERVKALEARPSVTAVKPAPLPASEIVTVNFPYNSAVFRPTASQEAALLPLLATASRIEIRGRTDGRLPSEGDERIALQRAQAAKDYLIGQGAPARIISVNYLSASDRITDNRTEAARAQNRRVEIEVFRR